MGSKFRRLRLLVLCIELRSLVKVREHRLADIVFARRAKISSGHGRISTKRSVDIVSVNSE